MTGTLLLDIIRHGIRGVSDACSISVSLHEFASLMRFAKEHAVLGMVANEAMAGQLKLDGGSPADRQRTVVELMRTDMTHKHSYGKFEEALARFATIVNRHELRYVVFKGVAVARYYPVPYARTMGDIDFYVHPHDFERAVDVIERELHVEMEKEDVDKHFSFDYQGIRFEMHYQIETFGSGKHQQYFNRMVDESIARGADFFSIADTESDAENVSVAVLPPTEDLIVVFKHWFNHLLVEGVGLRQTVDLAVLLQACHDKINVARLMSALDSIGYMRAFRAMLAMQKKYFGVNCVEDFCVLNGRDERYGEKLMAAVLESGNFGRKAYRNLVSGKRRSLETAKRALGHCLRFFWLAPCDICCLVPKRIGITLKQRV